MPVPQPRDLTEEIMKLIWESESKHNTWKGLIWNDFPLSDHEAAEILKRLRKTAEEILKIAVPF